MKVTPDYGTMDRDEIWGIAVDVLTEHFTKEGYDVHYNSAVQALHIIDREPGNPHDRGGSRLTQIAHTTRFNMLGPRLDARHLLGAARRVVQDDVPDYEEPEDSELSHIEVEVEGPMAALGTHHCQICGQLYLTFEGASNCARMDHERKQR